MAVHFREGKFGLVMAYKCRVMVFQISRSPFGAIVTRGWSSVKYELMRSKSPSGISPPLVLEVDRQLFDGKADRSLYTDSRSRRLGPQTHLHSQITCFHSDAPKWRFSLLRLMLHLRTRAPMTCIL